MARSRGHVILLVGPSCAGKSTLADAVQTLSNVPYLIQSLDGLFAVVFASSQGPGVLLSALPVLLYQGSLTMAATLLKPLLTAVTVANMSAVGGLLIVVIGINLLGITKIRVGNILPAIFLPLVYQVLRHTF